MITAARLCITFAILAVNAHAATFYVAPDGRAGWSGRLDRPNAQGTDGPLDSLVVARDKIRELRRAGNRGPFTVEMRGGTYFLTEPLVLMPEDSGTAAAPVVYMAYPHERPVISGGRRITNWVKQDNRLWTASAPFDFHQLFVAGKRAVRARLPNQGYYRLDGNVLRHENQRSAQRPLVFGFIGDEIRKSWVERGDVEVMVLCAWQEARGLLTAVDETARTATVATDVPGFCPPSGTNETAYYYVENAPEALNRDMAREGGRPLEYTPSDWYLDRKTGTVTFWPKSLDLTRDEVIASGLEQLVQIRGEPEKGRLVHDIVFRGLDFRHSDWKLPAGGYYGMQAASGLPGAFDAEGAERILIEHCMFTQMGGYAISFGRGSFRNRIVANDIFDMGGGGIKIGEPIMNRQRENPAERNGGNLVADNHLHHLGVVFPASVGVLVAQSSDNTVTHNHIHDLFFSGISVGWTWQFKLTSLQNNIIEYNHIHDIGQNVMSDMGGIYTLGEQPGTILRNNLIHDVNDLVYGGWGLYLDQATSNIVVEKNVVYGCKTGGFELNFGRDNLVRNNIFAYGKDYQWMRSRPRSGNSLTLQRNIVYFDEGELLGGPWWTAGNQKMDHNIYWDARGEPIRPAGKSWKEWQATGLDPGSVVADPRFINPDRGDFRLQNGSPVLKMGFVPIDVSTVGLRVTPGPAGLGQETGRQ